MRPHKPMMDALIKGVHMSGAFTFEASHARLVAGMQPKATGSALACKLPTAAI